MESCKASGPELGSGSKWLRAASTSPSHTSAGHVVDHLDAVAVRVEDVGAVGHAVIAAQHDRHVHRLDVCELREPLLARPVAEREMGEARAPWRRCSSAASAAPLPGRGSPAARCRDGGRGGRGRSASPGSARTTTRTCRTARIRARRNRTDATPRCRAPPTPDGSPTDATDE